MVKAAAHGIAGDRSWDSPLFGTLAAISVVGVVVRPRPASLIPLH
jgi:hypothetical protein